MPREHFSFSRRIFRAMGAHVPLVRLGTKLQLACSTYWAPYLSVEQPASRDPPISGDLWREGAATNVRSSTCPLACIRMPSIRHTGSSAMTLFRNSRVWSLNEIPVIFSTIRHSGTLWRLRAEHARLWILRLARLECLYQQICILGSGMGRHPTAYLSNATLSTINRRP